MQVHNGKDHKARGDTCGSCPLTSSLFYSHDVMISFPLTNRSALNHRITLDLMEEPRTNAADEHEAQVKKEERPSGNFSGRCVSYLDIVVHFGVSCSSSCVSRT